MLNIWKISVLLLLVVLFPLSIHASEITNQEEIRNAQKLLYDHGFEPGPEDGVIGTKTRDAISKFTYLMSLMSTGGKQTSELLQSVYYDLLFTSPPKKWLAVSIEAPNFFVSDIHENRRSAENDARTRCKRKMGRKHCPTIFAFKFNPVIIVIKCGKKRGRIGAAAGSSTENVKRELLEIVSKHGYSENSCNFYGPFSVN